VVVCSLCVLGLPDLDFGRQLNDAMVSPTTECRLTSAMTKHSTGENRADKHQRQDKKRTQG
jgi:hypothetical protein